MVIFFILFFFFQTTYDKRKAILHRHLLDPAVFAEELFQVALPHSVRQSAHEDTGTHVWKTNGNSLVQNTIIIETNRA